MLGHEWDGQLVQPFSRAIINVKRIYPFEKVINSCLETNIITYQNIGEVVKVKVLSMFTTTTIHW